MSGTAYQVPPSGVVLPTAVVVSGRRPLVSARPGEGLVSQNQPAEFLCRIVGGQGAIELEGSQEVVEDGVAGCQADGLLKL